jgi:hypothetical protein
VFRKKRIIFAKGLEWREPIEPTCEIDFCAQRLANDQSQGALHLWPFIETNVTAVLVRSAVGSRQKIRALKPPHHSVTANE